MKENNKKIEIIICSLSITIGLLIGFVIIYCIENDITIIKEEYLQNSLTLNIVLILVSYIISIAIHELTHFFTFKKYKIKIKGIIILGCILIDEKNKWKFSFKPALIALLGGVVVPKYNKVNNEEEFNKLREIISKAMISAPIASAILGIIAVIVNITTLNIIPNNIKSTVFIITISMIIISIITTLSSLYENQYVVGDFPAYKLFRKDKFFSAIQVYEYGMFADNQYETRVNSNYLRKIIYEELESRYEKKTIDSYTIGIIDIIIQDYLIEIIDELPEVIITYSNYINDNKEKFINDTNNIGILVRIAYLFNKLNKRESVNDLYKFLNDKFKDKDEYYKKQLDHILGICDNKEYLSNIKNIKTNELNQLLEVFEVYYKDEMKISFMKFNL